MFDMLNLRALFFFMLETPTDSLCRFLAIISVLYAKSSVLIMRRHFDLILCLSPTKTYMLYLHIVFNMVGML